MCLTLLGNPITMFTEFLPDFTTSLEETTSQLDNAILKYRWPIYALKGETYYYIKERLLLLTSSFLSHASWQSVATSGSNIWARHNGY